MFSFINKLSGKKQMIDVSYNSDSKANLIIKDKNQHIVLRLNNICCFHFLSETKDEWTLFLNADDRISNKFSKEEIEEIWSHCSKINGYKRLGNIFINTNFIEIFEVFDEKQLKLKYMNMNKSYYFQVPGFSSNELASILTE